MSVSNNYFALVVKLKDIVYVFVEWTNKQFIFLHDKKKGGRTTTTTTKINRNNKMFTCCTHSPSNKKVKKKPKKAWTDREFKMIYINITHFRHENIKMQNAQRRKNANKVRREQKKRKIILSMTMEMDTKLTGNKKKNLEQI